MLNNLLARFQKSYCLALPGQLQHWLHLRPIMWDHEGWGPGTGEFYTISR